VTFDPSAPVPPVPQPPAQPPVQAPVQLQAPAPQAPAPQPERPKGFAGALTAAIIVSALPVIVIPAIMIWMFVSIAQLPPATDDPYAGAWTDDPYAEDPLAEDPAAAGDLPIDLPWDLEVDGGAYIALASSFPADDAWTADASDGGNSMTYQNAATGCSVWYTNGSDGSDLTGDDDRTASLALIDSTFGTTVDPANAYDVALIAGDGVDTGVADAVAIDLEGDRFYTVIARSITDLGEAVIVSVDCDAAEKLPDAVAAATDLLTVGLVPADTVE